MQRCAYGKMDLQPVYNPAILTLRRTVRSLYSAFYGGALRPQVQDGAMLQIVGQSFRHCDRIARRDVLRIGSLFWGGATLADLLRHRACAREHGLPGPDGVPDTAVIQLSCGGGPSQIDMYDLKPHAPAEIRGEFQEISTSVPGIRISEHLPRQAAIMDKLAIVRTVSHTNSTHLPSSHLMQTGYEVPMAVAGQNVHPSSGSITARTRGPFFRGVPAYVAVPRGQAFSSAAYLGPACDPYATEVEPNADDFHIPNLTLPREVTRQRAFHRSTLLKQLDDSRRAIESAGRDGAINRYPNVAQAFDIRQESTATRDRYGRTSMGQNLLLARRLVEAGVSFVSCLSGGGWDTHEDNFRRQKDILLPRVDQAVSALVSDLHDRGLEKRVLVNVMGEFGRTPHINKDAGRDHWPGAFCALFAGGGIRAGQMIGTTDAHAAYPTSAPFSPGDVLATIYHVLGVDVRQEFHDRSGRTFPVLREGTPISELVG